MSRSGYDDGESDNPIGYLWASIVGRAIEGKRGQKLLRDLAAALDALPEKRLVSGSFLRNDGEVCTLGALGKARGLDMSDLEKAARDNIDDYCVDVARPAGRVFDVARSMAAEIMYQNDTAPYGGLYGYPDLGGVETPAARWQRMRAWVQRRIKET